MGEWLCREQRLGGRHQEYTKQLHCRGESERSRIELGAAHEGPPELELVGVGGECVGERKRGEMPGAGCRAA